MKGIVAILKHIGKFIMGLGTFTLGICVLLIIVLALSANKTETKPTVPDGAVLVLAPSGVIVEEKQKVSSLDLALKEFQDVPVETSIHDIMDALEKATNDDRIAALAISTDSMFGAAPSHLHLIAGGIKAFKESGKKVYAISTAYSQSDYILAAQADTIFMNPAGAVVVEGYSQYTLFYKDLLEKLGITMNIFRVGTFKSAVEPYIRNDMSEAAREANEAFLDNLWGSYEDTVTSARGMETGQLSRNIANMEDLLRQSEGDMAKLALQTGLVDQLVHRTVWQDALMDEYGTNDSGESFKQIHFMEYLDASEPAPVSNNQIAVIIAQGTITVGDGPVTVAGSGRLTKQIRAARTDGNIKAIVLRVNSPGGSAFASELIRQELALAQQDGIKVIASFGPVAASGGYWISASADEIWAAPTTITGSIGIFAAIPTFENTLAKAGIYSDGVGTTPLAGAYGLDRPLNDKVKNILQQTTEGGYQQFLSLVAENREMTIEDVDKIAQGRVWVGSTAKELGLVDHLGTFKDAVAAAARAAGVEDDYQTVFYTEKPDEWEQFFAEILNASMVQSLLPDVTPSPAVAAAMKLAKEAEVLLNLNDPMGRYVMCLECKVQ